MMYLLQPTCLPRIYLTTLQCHGTGTPVGDPVEAISVGNVFGVPSDGVYIGSVKPNLGHSEASAGISSLMKAVLALEHKTIPPNIKFKVPNPRSKLTLCCLKGSLVNKPIVPFAEKKITVPVKPMPWPQGKAHRISVNSFGIGGTNAHVRISPVKRPTYTDTNTHTSVLLNLPSNTFKIFRHLS